MAQWYSREASGKFEGVFSLLLTPFHENGDVNWQAYDRYVEWQLERKPNGLFGVCGSSEMKWLTLEEREQLANRAVKLAGNVPVVITGNLGSDPAPHDLQAHRAVAGYGHRIDLPQSRQAEAGYGACSKGLVYRWQTRLIAKQA
ncbi:dihydrodipicolinate synthase family protein [Paenibacillus chungangensis]|uniref:Dihydrodipicolinate synthase family protein n=1 Tax=Paenibacillus chungangensis TaxID=696535 RepID=A0ABW3HKL2_9BACL